MDREAADLIAGIGKSLASDGFGEDVLRLIGMADMKALEPPERLQLLMLQGDLLSLHGEWPRARECFAESASIAEALADDRGWARAVLELGVLDYRHGDHAAAREQYRKALEIVGGEDLSTTARIHNALGILEWEAGDLTKATMLYESSKSAYDAAGDQAGVAGALNNLGILRWQQGDTDGALTLYAEALTLSEELGDRRTVAILYNNIGEAYRRKKDAENARKFYERSLSLSETLGFLWQMGEVHRNLGQLLDSTAGRTHLSQARDIFDSLGAERDAARVAELMEQRESRTG
jgi:tetratricopeptide (TPR) repeat protein